MNFAALKRRVERSERLVSGRTMQTQQQLSALKSAWRESWTPGRIVVVGLIGGFIVGRTQPTRVLAQLGALGGSRWIELIGSTSGLVASLQSAFAAASAKSATKAADDTADEAADAAQQARDAEKTAEEPGAEAVEERIGC